MRETKQAGIDLIRHFEGCELTAYPDPATGDEPWTIGVGHTGADVHPGLAITQSEADALLKRDLKRFERGVTLALCTEINDNQYAACISFSFNLGNAAFKSSTLLQKINARDFDCAADEFLRWNKAGGRVMAGLTKRREAERELFLTPVKK